MAATTADPQREKGRWVVKASQGSRDSINPVRGFEENIFKDVLKNRRTDIEFIKLSIGTQTQNISLPFCVLFTSAKLLVYM